MKFYTEEGNWDLVGNNTPIFFIRDPILVSCNIDNNVNSMFSSDWVPVVYQCSNFCQCAIVLFAQR